MGTNDWSIMRLEGKTPARARSTQPPTWSDRCAGLPDSQVQGGLSPASGFCLGPYEPFRVEVHHEREAIRVVPVGELDLATVDQIEQQLRNLASDGAGHLVLDLRGLVFMDCTGLRLVLGWVARAVQDEFDLSLIQGPPAIWRVFELTGLNEQLSFRAR